MKTSVLVLFLCIFSVQGRNLRQVRETQSTSDGGNAWSFSNLFGGLIDKIQDGPLEKVKKGLSRFWSGKDTNNFEEDLKSRPIIETKDQFSNLTTEPVKDEVAEPVGNLPIEHVKKTIADGLDHLPNEHTNNTIIDHIEDTITESVDNLPMGKVNQSNICLDTIIHNVTMKSATESLVNLHITQSKEAIVDPETKPLKDGLTESFEILPNNVGIEHMNDTFIEGTGNHPIENSNQSDIDSIDNISTELAKVTVTERGDHLPIEKTIEDVTDSPNINGDLQTLKNGVTKSTGSFPIDNVKISETFNEHVKEALFGGSLDTVIIGGQDSLLFEQVNQTTVDSLELAKESQTESPIENTKDSILDGLSNPSIQPIKKMSTDAITNVNIEKVKNTVIEGLGNLTIGNFGKTVSEGIGNLKIEHAKDIVLEGLNSLNNVSINHVKDTVIEGIGNLPVDYVKDTVSESIGSFDIEQAKASILEGLNNIAIDQVKQGLENLTLENAQDTLHTYADKIGDIEDTLQEITDNFRNVSTNGIGFDDLKKLTAHIPENLSIQDGLQAIADQVPDAVLENETLQGYYKDIEGQFSQLGGTLANFFS